MALRVVGVDPGLTRCGLAVVDVETNRRATLVDVTVVGTPPGRLTRSAPAGHRRRHRRLARPPQARRRGDRAGVQPAQRQHRHGHCPGLGHRDRCGRPSRNPGGAAHPHRGQGRGDGIGQSDKAAVGKMVAKILRLDEPPSARRRGRRRWLGDHPRLARRAFAPGSRPRPPPTRGTSSGLTAAQRAWMRRPRPERKSARPDTGLRAGTGFVRRSKPRQIASSRYAIRRYIRIAGCGGRPTPNARRWLGHDQYAEGHGPASRPEQRGHRGRRLRHAGAGDPATLSGPARGPRERSCRPPWWSARIR